MEKRIVVAGSRGYNNYEQAKAYIDKCISRIKNQYDLIFISGGCRGADMLGERYAKENGYRVERYPADWKKYGKAAGPKRNLEMAKSSNYVICFWNGKSKGTKTMIEYAQSLEKPIRIKIIP